MDTNPDVKLLNAYSQDFVDQAKCKEIALDQIPGLRRRLPGRRRLRPRRDRRRDARRASGAIGVDADQSFTGRCILTSALKPLRRRSSTVDQGVRGRHASRAARTGLRRRGATRTRRCSRRSARTCRRTCRTPSTTRSGEAHQRRDRPAGDDRGVKKLGRPMCGAGPAGRPGTPPLAMDRDARPRAQGDHEALPGRRRERPASTSTCAAARCTRSSARTAPASRR